MLILIADTNLFFECKALDQLPWEELGSGHIVILLTKSPFENHRWATRRSSRAPMATWIMASDTSRRFS